MEVKPQGSVCEAKLYRELGTRDNQAMSLLWHRFRIRISRIENIVDRGCSLNDRHDASEEQLPLLSDTEADADRQGRPSAKVAMRVS